MTNHASLLEQKQTRKQAYGRQYYLMNKDRYITNYETKRETFYTCAVCNTLLRLVSKAAHEKSRKHLYAYYDCSRATADATGGVRDAQSTKGEDQGQLQAKQGADQTERSSTEAEPGAI
jgi:hypothetical protein